MQNFGKIKNAFNELLVEGIAKQADTNKQLFKKYVKTLKENEALKTQFLVFNNIENKIESDSLKATLFLQENIGLLKKFDKKDLLESNKKLAKIVNISEEDYELIKLHENISTLIFTENSSKNINKIVEATSDIIEFMKTNKLKEVNESLDLPNSVLTGIMVGKFNEKYSSLDETQKKVLKTLIESADEEKKEIYSSIVRECIDLINDKLEESSIDIKDKLLRVKDKLLNDKQEVNEDFNKNISKLLELRESLK
jgi:hypothetical protein